MSTPTLGAALAALEVVATTAGVDATTARAEGESLAATVAEPNKGAFADWAAETGHAGDGAAEAFFDAAVRGRRFRVAPTPTMGVLELERSAHAPAYASALADVASAAAELGTPDPRAVGNAAMAASAQLGGSSLDLRAPWRTGLDKLDRPKVVEPVETPTKLVEPVETPTKLVEQTPKLVEPVETPTKSVEELLAELDSLTGLDAVKQEIHKQAAVLRIEGLRKEAGLGQPTITRHLVFNGNPGTGKTTVARLVAGIYRALGLLSKGQLIEVDRSELVAGYLGQTAEKTSQVVTSAEGGVLFIDEAYSLSGDQYGKEAIDTLVKEMEDKRNDLVVIVAGYPVPMAGFIAENPGLESRFRTMLDFADYTDDELVTIFASMAKAADYDADDAVLARLRDVLRDTERGPSFGNARFVRNALEAAIGRQAWRLRDIQAPTVEQLRSLSAADLGPDTVDIVAGDTGGADAAPAAPSPAKEDA